MWLLTRLSLGRHSTIIQIPSFRRKKTERIEADITGSAGILLHVQLHTTQWSRIVTQQWMLEGASGDCLDQHPAQSRVNQRTLLRIVCSQVLNVSMDGNSIRYLSNLFQYSIILTLISVCTHCLLSIHWVSPDSSGCLLYSHLSSIYTHWNKPFSLPCSRLNSPKLSQPLLIREGSTLEKVARRSCGCPLPGNVQGQVGWSSEQPGLVEDVPAHGRGGGTRWSLRSLPTLTILWFYDSMII